MHLDAFTGSDTFVADLKFRHYLVELCRVNSTGFSAFVNKIAM